LNPWPLTVAFTLDLWAASAPAQPAAIPYDVQATFHDRFSGDSNDT